MNIRTAKEQALAALQGGHITTERLTTAVIEACRLNDYPTLEEVAQVTSAVLCQLYSDAERLEGRAFFDRVGGQEASELVTDLIDKADPSNMPPVDHYKATLTEHFPLIDPHRFLPQYLKAAKRFIIKSGIFG